MIKLSHSCISCFKKCAEMYKNRYVLGLIPDTETESQRYGTNWHKIQEINNLQPGAACPDCAKHPDNAECPLCNKTGVVEDGGMDAVVRYLNHVYSNVPAGKTVEEYETERVILLYSLIGYNWYYQNSQGQETVLAQELKFSIPLTSPISGRKLPNVEINGMIDKVVDRGCKVFVKEHKSTGSSIEPDSTYWGHLNLDSQTTLYPYALRVSQALRELAGIGRYEDQSVGVLYDVWHRPGIRPKALSQGDSKAFMESGEYCGQKFEIGDGVVNGVPYTAEPGKKEGTFAIRETPDMFGARLLQDITERPEFYFCMKEIPRTDDDLARFERQIFNVFQAIRMLAKTDGWWQDESQCEATYKCPYISLCYNNVEIDPENPPPGFIYRKRKEQE